MMREIILHLDCKHSEKGSNEKPCVDFFSEEGEHHYAEDCPYFEYPDYDSSTSTKIGENDE